MRTFLAGAQWHLHEVRYVWQHDGVFVSYAHHPVGEKLEAKKARQPYSPASLNGLSDEEKQEVAGGPFVRWLHDRASEHITWLYWRGPHRIIGAPPIEHNGSAFVLDCGRGPFVVTAAHVFSQYLADKARTRQLSLQIGNLSFDPEERLIDCGANRRIDIATFRINSSEVVALDKKVVVAEDAAWPAPPNPGELALYGGYLGSQRVVVGRNEISFGLHLGMTPITDFTEHQIRCRFHRHSWVDVRGLGLPLPGFNLGGVSGGPLLAPVYDGDWSWRLVGVISEAQMHPEYETITAVRAHFILPDGRISGPSQ
jgi:hypothetical protein